MAELLETELTSLIPSRQELLVPRNQMQLDKEMMKKIEEVADGDPGTIKILTGFVTKLNGTVDIPRSERKLHGQTKSRRKG